MTGINTSYSPDTLEAAVAHLRASELAHLEALQMATLPDGTALYPADLIMHGVAQRSLQLISGFTVMVEQSNVVCAIPLLRLQLDNVMRFYALWLVPDPDQVLSALLSDTPFKKLKSSNGRQLTDSYLAEQLSEHHPWVSNVYKRTSGFVHLSTPGLLSGVVAVGNDATKVVSMSIGREAGRKWLDTEKKEAVDAFIAATDALLHLFVSWAVTKETAAKQRPAEADKGGVITLRHDSRGIAERSLGVGLASSGCVIEEK